ncbi:hypothetical protein Daus18300_007176 [Diaporthe australafricana]|uniref:Uncharacterized protein n=1 Tax=Diaporthe australafricana TaxID=127596 RepID=A0ABR3WPE2_9PEZI
MNDKAAQCSGPLQSEGDGVAQSELKDINVQLKMMYKEIKYATNLIRRDAGDESDSEDPEQGETSAAAVTAEVVTAEVEEAAAWGSQAGKQPDNEENADSFVYKVEYRDMDDSRKVLQTQILKQPFELGRDTSNPGKRPAEDKEQTIAQISTSVFIHHRDLKKRVQAGFLDHPGVDIQQSMELKSQPLINALREIVKYYPGVNLDKESVSLPEPFCILGHYMQELGAFRDRLEQDSKGAEKDEAEGDSSNKSTTTRYPEDKEHDTMQMASRHITMMLSFLRSNIYKQKLEEEQARHECADPTCTFPMLWLLYKPGSTVFVDSAGKTEA